ncbi:MAG: 2OG-Fe(II) oxygenase [Candidatus Melainabacteria bacterium]|nr:2OG-Fe(II) oxygenase [Candidatus Melainabacteria bacterium]
MNIQITSSGFNLTANEKDLNLLKKEFDKKHCIKLTNFLEKDLLGLIQLKIDECDDFFTVNYPASNQDNPMCRLKDKNLECLLRFFVNDKKLFQVIEKVTGCCKIGSFTGRICRMSPGTGHRDAWHNDLVDNRMIAMSINLSTKAYEGGILQLKDINIGKVVKEVANTGFGDAVIFRISPKLVHRLTEVTGKASRTFFAGWFRSKPIYKPVFEDCSRSITFDRNLSEAKKYNTDIVLSRSQNLFFQDSKDKVLVFNPVTGVCFGLDSIGGKILKILDRPKSFFEIRNLILKEYDVGGKECEIDLRNLIRQMKINRLVCTEMTR